MRIRSLTGRLTPVLFLLGLAGAASGQTLTVNPSTLSFNVAAGVQTSASQIVNVSPDFNATGSPLAFVVNTAATWLRVNGTTSGNTENMPPAGVNLLVTVNTVGLTVGATYNGFFTVQIPGQSSTAKVVNVTLVVNASSSLFAAPTSLTFSATQGAQIGTPSSQNVTISSTSNSLAFTLTSNTTVAPNWISLSSTGGVTGASSGTFSVSVIPGSLQAGTYTGNIVAQSTTTGDLAQIPVTLTISNTTTLTVTPTAPLPFLFQIGGAVPAPQSLSVASNGSAVTFTVAQNPNTSWLVINPLSGTASSTTPSAISLSVNPSGLPAGTQSTSVIVTPSGGAALPAIPVSLTVTNNPVLQVTPGSIAFTAQFAGSSPIDQILNLTAVGGAVGFSFATDAPWLTLVSNVNSTPAQVTLHVNSSGLGVGSYTGRVSLRPTNGDNYTINIPVTLTVVNATQVTAAPATLLFSFQNNVGGVSQQAVAIRTTGQQVGLLNSTVTTAACGTGWLAASLSQNSTPATLTVTVTPAGLAAGTCTGNIAITSAGNAAANVAVTVVISAANVLTIGQPAGFGNETVTATPFGQSVISKSISLTSTDTTAPVDFSAAATTNVSGGWLTVGPGTGTTPQNLVVSILPGGLAPGTYTGQISISSTTFPGSLPNKTFLVPITLTINPSVTVTVTPTALTFTQVQGGATPNNQSLVLASTGGTGQFTTTITQITGGDWLDANPTSGNADRTLTVSVKANSLPASTTPYQAQITLAFANASTPPITVPVSLTVTAGALLTVSPQTLNFAFQIGGTAPTSQKITVTSASAAQFSVGTTSTPGGWLNVDSSSGTTPKDIVVTVTPGTLAAGTYNGSVTITAQGSSTPITVPVVFMVTASPAPVITTVTSTASNLAGNIAPGELVTMKGIGLGPVSPPNGGLFSVNAQGRLNDTLFGVRVLFDGIPGTPIYVSAVQVNAIAPWEIGGRVTTNVVVEYLNIQSAAVQVRVADVAPGIFTLNSTGSGQAAVANQDGSFNGPLGGNTRPATQNSVIAVYMTGGGQTNPPSTTGSVNPGNVLLRVNALVTATINGANAIVEFAGEAPNLVNGVMQINLRVPLGVSGNNLPVEIRFNGIPTPNGPTVAVQ